MMNFYYDPIKGLQYEYLGELLIVDITQLPEDIEIKEFWQMWRESHSLGFIDFSGVDLVGQITNFIKI